jgi:ubiquinone/menaquinone biosynthesis C-methylase UbiE
MKNNIPSEKYILGTEQAELHRLGLQHQVWAAEARQGWELGGFRSGQSLLDLGCGPGFCTLELAYMAGQQGRVVGVDQSESYIQFLQGLTALHGLPVELQNCSFDDMQLAANSLDGAFCRWALAWVPNPADIVAKVQDALRPGGRFVVQEYFDWSVFQSEPALPHLKKGIAACYKSMKEQSGDIDVGRKLPQIAEDLGMKVCHTRLIAKLAAPHELTWEWPYSFFLIYLPKVAQRGFLTDAECAAALADLESLSKMPQARIFCPVVMETVLEKP